MTATATAAKPREVTYFEMTGTADGPKMRLTKASAKALVNARDVLLVLAKAGMIFPSADGIAKIVNAFILSPQMDQHLRDDDV